MTVSESLQITYERLSGLDTYPVNSVPVDVSLPYCTYEKSVGENVPITVRLYFYTESESVPDAAAEAFCKPLRNGGINIRHDDGNVWMNLSEPQWYGSTGEDDTRIKVRSINLALQFE